MISVTFESAIYFKWNMWKILVDDILPISGTDLIELLKILSVVQLVLKSFHFLIKNVFFFR